MRAGPRAVEPARHATGRRARGGLPVAVARARFRAPALVLAAALGLGGGAALAWSGPPDAVRRAAALLGGGGVVTATAADAEAVAELGGADGSRSSRSGRVVPPDLPTPVASGALAPGDAPSSAGSAEPAGAEPAGAEPLPLYDPDAVDAAGLTFADRQAGLTSLALPTAATGQLAVAPGSSPAPDPGAQRVVRIRVEVEVGLDVDPGRFATAVLAILNDPRGWGADGSVSFARTDGDADLRVVLASPDLVDDLCAPLETVGSFSCGTNGHAALNHTRWVGGTPEFTDLAQYRQYLVNHEVGHLLGHRHVECPGDGEVAPVMQQQTVGVAPCLPNGWPFPG